MEYMEILSALAVPSTGALRNRFICESSFRDLDMEIKVFL